MEAMIVFMTHANEIAEAWKQRATSPDDDCDIVVIYGDAKLSRSTKHEFSIDRDGKSAKILRLSEFARTALSSHVDTVLLHLQTLNDEDMPVIFIDDRNRCIAAPNDAIVDFLNGGDDDGDEWTDAVENAKRELGYS